MTTVVDNGVLLPSTLLCVTNVKALYKIMGIAIHGEEDYLLTGDLLDMSIDLYDKFKLKDRVGRNRSPFASPFGREVRNRSSLWVPVSRYRLIRVI
jgi:hypothetical protein